MRETGIAAVFERIDRTFAIAGLVMLIQLVEAARECSVRVYPISTFYHPAFKSIASDRPAGLVMGYALGEQPLIAN